MTVLVTGGWGFIGRHLARALAGRGDRVVVFDAAAPDAEEAARVLGRGITVVSGDITQPDAVRDVMRDSRADSVIHAAAVVGVASTARDPRQAAEVNILGALSVFEAASELGIRRLVDLSSEEVYGHFAADPVTEETPGDPVSPYGISKRAVEQLGRYYAEQRGLGYVAARLCWVYGPEFPRERLPLTWLADVAGGRTSSLESGGDQRIDFTYVSDAVRGVLAVLDAPALRGRAYHVATGTSTSVRELAQVMRGLWPDWSVQLGDGPLRLAPGVNAATKGALSVKKAEADLGYRPAVPLSEGLRRTYDWVSRTQGAAVRPGEASRSGAPRAGGPRRP
ncbi:MAG: NAD(P)-dependent oxidoreductase [Streptosporangiales bacterium]|nr:NAD(P)-dependent oxidoreductase [Streptosporangiales bacterium]